MRKLEITEMHRLTAAEFKAAAKTPVCVILDNIRSRHNIGAIFRTADAFRIEELLLCGITDCPPSPEIHKTALGAEDSVAWRHFEDPKEAVEELRARGYKIAALEQAEGSVMLQDLQYTAGEKIAVIVGNEVHGVDQSIVDMCDLCIEIPQTGTKHSLNVSVATGVMLWELFKVSL